jgi:hypothetical protein
VFDGRQPIELHGRRVQFLHRDHPGRHGGHGVGAKDPETAAEVALALLYRKLGYAGVQNPTDEAVQTAIDNFGEVDGRYGKAVMDCAKQLKNGDFSGAISTLQTYANWVAGGRK